MSQINVQTRSIVDRNTWPPEQLKTFAPLLYIYYQGHQTKEQVSEIAKLMCTGSITTITNHDLSANENLCNNEKLCKVLNSSTTTKEIESILTPLENGIESCLILVEGSPGIGKSFLLKEIAYRWGKKQLLQKFELVLLLCFRDPSLQQVSSVNDLLQLFCRGDKDATEIVNACTTHLFSNHGKSLTLLLDGYDECPKNLQENGLIAGIIQRHVLPLCGLIISSRPHASEHLRQQATITVEILGFTETERQLYIKNAMQDQEHKIKELTQYLYQQPSIDSICYIPFNMVILLYLYKQGVSLPKNSTEMYHHFICSAVSRHLFKCGNPLTENVTNLTNLPEPYITIVNQLSMFSLQSLNNNKLIFTLDEITSVCPNIVAVPGGINGFGLLQAVQHFGLYTKVMTLNFVHFTVQEFLAAYYISRLPPNEELRMIETYFFSNIHFNVFSLYVSLTKGQRLPFKQFLSDGNKDIVISQKFLKTPIKCLRLYCSFNEANDRIMCDSIEQAKIFESTILDFKWKVITGSDVQCLSMFLASSFKKKWLKLKLSRGYIQDKGLNILHRGLHRSSDIIINELHLESNCLTIQSSSSISDITVKCKVKVLKISDNNIIGENEQLYSMLLNPFSVLMQLYMFNINLSSTGAIKLFKSLKDNNELKELNVAINSITDDACDAIVTALKTNCCLVTLSMYDNPMTGEAIKSIVQCLEVNNVLQLLELPHCPQSIEESIVSLEKIINKKRVSQGFQAKLKINV